MMFTHIYNNFHAPKTRCWYAKLADANTISQAFGSNNHNENEHTCDDNNNNIKAMS
jgi:hypothetical protein